MAASGSHETALRRAGRLKRLYRWHWTSAAVSLVGLLAFAITGFTLNHAADIEARATIDLREAALPAPLRPLVVRDDDRRGTRAPLPSPIVAWIDEALGVDGLDAREAEWSPDEIYLSLPRPGGDAWLRIDRDSGEVEYERTDRGWVAWFNDLHKGRHTGAAWSLFIDAFAIACVVFAATGLSILSLHAANRPMAWPLVALGALVPALVLLLFVH